MSAPATTPVTPHRGAGPAMAAAVFLRRSLRHNLRDPEALLLHVLLPSLLMVLFTYVFGGAIQQDGRYIDYVTPGIILLCSGFGAATTAVSVSRDMTSGTIHRLRTLPIPSATVLVGHTGASLLRNLVATTMVIGVGVLLGYRPQAGVGGWIAALALIALWILAITALFALIGLVAGSPEAAGGYGFVLLFLPYVSSAFVPLSTMPAWLQSFAERQPLTPLTEAVRALLSGPPPGADAWAAVAWSTAVLALATALIAWRFPRTWRLRGTD